MTPNERAAIEKYVEFHMHTMVAQIEKEVGSEHRLMMLTLANDAVEDLSVTLEAQIEIDEAEHLEHQLRSHKNKK